MTKINEMKIMKIDVCKFENNLFNDTLIIVDCILKNEYKTRAMINNDRIKYFFININIAHKMCEALNLDLLN